MTKIIAKGLLTHWTKDHSSHDEVLAYKKEPDSYFYRRVEKLIEMKAPAIIIANSSRLVGNFKTITSVDLLLLINSKYSGKGAAIGYDDECTEPCNVLSRHHSFTLTTALKSYTINYDDLENTLYFWDPLREELYFPNSSITIHFKREDVYDAYCNVNSIARMHSEKTFVELMCKMKKWELTKINDIVITGKLEDHSDDQTVLHFAEFVPDDKNEKTMEIHHLSHYTSWLKEYNNVKCNSINVYGSFEMDVEGKSEMALLTPIES